MQRIRQVGPSDRGDVVLGWLTRLTVVLALVGLVGFDLVSVGVGRLQAEDRAQGAAREAVRAYADTADVQRAYEAALADLDGVDAVADTIAPATFVVSSDGSVTLTLTHTATTLVLDRIGPARQWATSTATVTRAPVR